MSDSTPEPEVVGIEIFDMDSDLDAALAAHEPLPDPLLVDLRMTVPDDAPRQMKLDLLAALGDTDAVRIGPDVELSVSVTAQGCTLAQADDLGRRFSEIFPGMKLETTQAYRGRHR